MKYFALPFASMLALSLSLFSTPAKASENLEAYSNDSSGIMQVSLKIQDWQDVIHLLPKEGLSELFEAFSEIQSELGEEIGEELEAEGNGDIDLSFDPFWDGLLNLGQKLSFAYRPNPGRAGDILFNLDLRSGDRLKRVFSEFARLAEKEGETRDFVREEFGGYTIYTMVFEEDDENYSHFSWALAGNQLMGNLGKDNRQLKNMLYRSAVLSPDSKFKLVNQTHFKSVSKSLGKEPLWFYADMKAVMNLIQHFLIEEGEKAENLAILDEIVPLMRGVGVSLKIKQNGLYFKSFVAEDRMQLSPSQRSYLEAFYETKENSLQPLIDGTPKTPLVFYGAHNIDTAFSHPYPLSLMAMGDDELMTDEMTEELMSLMKEFLGIEPDKDILPYMDGRLGLSVYQPENEELIPQTVLYLGLKEKTAAEFEGNFVKQMALNISELMGEESETIRFEASDSYKGVQMYRLVGMPELPEMEGALNPTLARKGSLMLLAQSPDALKAVIDGKSGNHRLKTMARQFDPKEALGYFFLDFNAIMRSLEKFNPEDEEIQEMAKALAPFEALYMSSRHLEGGTEGRFILQIQFKDIDWEALLKTLDDLDLDTEELGNAILGARP